MSKGLGWIERAILATFKYEDTDLTRDMVAAYVFGKLDNIPPTRSERVAFNRAIRSLIKKGLIEEITWTRYLLLTDGGQQWLDSSERRADA